MIFQKGSVRKIGLLVSEIKQLFGLDLPIDKIDSILVTSTLGDKLEGGKTLLIRSVSGVVKFPWVQNASEFKDAVVTSIDNHK